MAEYERVKVGKLKLKGEKRVYKKYRAKKRMHDEDLPGGSNKDVDGIQHGGWWKASSVADITGSVAVQFSDTPVYIKALNQGLFTVGAPHNEGEGPDPEEILTALPAGSDHIALKSGYGKYLSVDTNGRVTGVSDAIGSREQWQPIFQDGKTALLAPNDCFLGIDDDDNVIARSSKATTEQMITIRCIHERSREKSNATVELDKGKLKDVELSYVKMFQKFQDKKLKLNPDRRTELKNARNQGKLHEALLNRRAKMKADRYCK